MRPSVLTSMSKTDAGDRNQDRANGQHLVTGLAGVIAACRDVRSGETIARELLSVSRGSQIFVGEDRIDWVVPRFRLGDA
jgi:hypothetical protein